MKNNFLFAKKRTYRQFGFSMIEMLVVMFVVILVTIISLANYRSGQRKYVLTQSVQQMVSDIRKAQNMALSGFELADNYYGYGICIDKDDPYYIIYGDVNGNSTYQPADDVIETISLFPHGVEVQSVTPMSGTISIFFESPQPTTYINGNNAPGFSGTITLKIINSSLSNTIRVTTAGLIQVE